jgi:hypothetical protein
MDDASTRETGPGRLRHRDRHNAANRDCAQPVFAALRASTPLTHVFVGSRRVVVT